MALKSILFDLDGTLTDSGEGIMNCVELALHHYGIPIPPREELRIFVGPPLQENFLKFGIPEEEIDNAIKVFRSRYLTVGKFENFPYPGIPELLRKLKSQGHHLYVATSKPESTAKEILEKFDLSPYFDIICGATMDGTRQSKADVIQYLYDQTRETLPAIMVGDTSYDVEGANAHGIPTIGVAWGYGSIREMRNAGAVAIAQDVDELFELLIK